MMLTHIAYMCLHCTVDKVLSDISKDLKESGLYFKYMQDSGADE